MATTLALRCVLLGAMLIKTTSAAQCGDGYVPVIKFAGNRLFYQDAVGEEKEGATVAVAFSDAKTPRMFMFNYATTKDLNSQLNPKPDVMSQLDGVIAYTTLNGNGLKYQEFQLKRTIQQNKADKWEMTLKATAEFAGLTNSDKEVIFFCQDVDLPANLGPLKKLGNSKCAFGPYKSDAAKAVLPDNFKQKCSGDTVCQFNFGSNLVRVANKSSAAYDFGTFYNGAAAMVDTSLQQHWVGYGYDGQFRPVHCIGNTNDQTAYLPILVDHSFIGEGEPTTPPKADSCPASSYYEKASTHEVVETTTAEVGAQCDENAQSVEFVGFLVALSVASLLTCLFFVAIISTRCAAYCMKKDGKALPKKPWETLHTEDQTADVTIGVTENQSAYGTVTQSVMSNMSAVNSVNAAPK